MLRKITGVLILLGALSACRSHRAFIGDHPTELVGTWQLLIRSSCSEYGITADILVLHIDGTFEQSVGLRDGKQFERTGQHWRYYAGDGNGDIALDRRLEFFLPELSHTVISEGVPMSEVLLVEGGPAPVIVLHPDSDCVYRKVQ